jgi:hypothetical protein
VYVVVVVDVDVDVIVVVVVVPRPNELHPNKVSVSPPIASASDSATFDKDALDEN